jgi:NAD(P)H-hydrate epimerase
MTSQVDAITSGQMYRIENNGSNLLGLPKSFMMENAGHGLADYIISQFGTELSDRKIVSFCGTGNNGGDALVALRHISGYGGAEIIVVMLGDREKIKTEESLTNWRIIEKIKSIMIIQDPNQLPKLSNNDIIIDGIFGTGINGDIREPYSTAIDIINNSDAHVISVDIPSGLDPDNGSIHDKCVKADATITFHRIKKGLLNKNDITGNIFLEKIGIPIEAEVGVLT